MQIYNLVKICVCNMVGLQDTTESEDNACTRCGVAALPLKHGIVK